MIRTRRILIVLALGVGLVAAFAQVRDPRSSYSPPSTPADALLRRAPGSRTSAVTLTTKRIAIPSGSATPLFRVTVPAGNQSGSIAFVLTATIDNFHETRAARGLIAIHRKSGLDTARAYSVIPTPIAAVSSDATQTFGTFVCTDVGFTGAVGAPQTFDVAITSTITPVAGSTWTALLQLDIFNNNHNGITVAKLTDQFGAPLGTLLRDVLPRLDTQPALPETPPGK